MKTPDYIINQHFLISYIGSVLGECVTSSDDGPAWCHDSIPPNEYGQYAVWVKIRKSKPPRVTLDMDLAPDLAYRIIGYCAVMNVEWSW